MKPSERIKELEQQGYESDGYPQRFFNAILDYLDEEYEKQKGEQRGSDGTAG